MGLCVPVRAAHPCSSVVLPLVIALVLAVGFVPVLSRLPNHSSFSGYPSLLLFFDFFVRLVLPFLLPLPLLDFVLAFSVLPFVPFFFLLALVLVSFRGWRILCTYVYVV